MKFLYDLFPLLLFFAAFKLYDIYVATAVAIVASVVQVAAFWWRHRRFETLHLVTLAVIVVFGGLTLILRDDTFIKWKPTLVYWILATIVLGSQLLGQKTAIERLLGHQLTLPPQVKPGPNAVISTDFGSPLSMSASSTNITVGALMLP